jgi:hypothetical protein
MYCMSNRTEVKMNRLSTRLAFALSGALFLVANAQAGFKEDMLKQFGLGAGSSPAATETAGKPALSNLSQAEMAKGLKEALSKGVKNAIAQLGKNGGYLNDASVRIPMPEELARVEKLMRSLHQDKLADEFVATMNHAAEKAVPQAAGIFADAIKSMTMEDAQAILTGPDDAATQFFRKKSEAQLTERFRPIVAEATDKAGVTSAYKRMMAKTGSLAMLVGNANDLDGYVTNKALDGLFSKLAIEEKAIRTNPVARTTDLLKKVFGAVAK